MKKLLLALSTIVCGAVSAEASATITIDFETPIGAFKPVHGVNNGPYLIAIVTQNLQRFHKAAGFPFVRLHDVPLATGAPYAVDISSIFPCVDADDQDPKYYTFEKTDKVIEAIINNGGQVIYRLGQSIEHGDKFHTHPPKDFDKWARVCVNIVRHYNEGWANGFHYGIKRWEIWNEPEHPSCWTGTPQQFFELYSTAAKALKAHDASLLVGGPGVTSPTSPIVTPFLAYCKAQQAPLDFFSWHRYPTQPGDLVNAARSARNKLNTAGFTQTESYCTEWREMRGWDWPNWGVTREGTEQIEDMFDEFNGVNGMLFCATVFTLLQDEPIDIANFYTADTLPRFGLFDVYGYPYKAYAAFPAYNELFKIGTRVGVASSLGNAHVLAGVSSDGKAAALMVTSHDEAARQVTFSLENLPWSGATLCEILRADEQSDFGLVSEINLPSSTTSGTTEIPGRSISVFRFTPVNPETSLVTMK